MDVQSDSVDEMEGEEHEAAKEVVTSHREEGTSLSEEVIGTPEKGGDGEATEEDEEEDDDLMHPGEVSVGKKLWRFLTT